MINAKKFICSVCHKEKPILNDIGTGYVIYDNQKVCYKCDAEKVKLKLKTQNKIILYLVTNNNKKPYVCNWTGYIKYGIKAWKKGIHNMAGTRIDVWFKAEEFNWHGVQYGTMTQICYCSKLKH